MEHIITGINVLLVMLSNKLCMTAAFLKNVIISF